MGLLLMFIQTETALTYDAVRLLGVALDRMESQWNVRTVNLSCNTESNDAWYFGSTLYGYLSSVRYFLTQVYLYLS